MAKSKKADRQSQVTYLRLALLDSMAHLSRMIAAYEEHAGACTCGAGDPEYAARLASAKAQHKRSLDAHHVTREWQNL